MPALLNPGLTCWKVARATRLSLIQDAGPYFAHLADAFTRAQRTIFILGWDLDSRTFLRANDVASTEEPQLPAAERQLLPVLLQCLARRPELEIFVLAWDFSFIYAFEREPAPRRQFGGAHPRLHFSMDADHGSGGSHHQKIVVIDDQVGFLGGIDLTFHRWDNPSHPVTDPRRVDADGHTYGPFHDVHAAVAGPAAAVLGELARSRWRSRRRPRAPDVLSATATPGSAGAEDRDNDRDNDRNDLDSAWPPNLHVDAESVDVGLSRTFTHPAQPTIREVEAITLAAIRSARHYIYIENQYLTSRSAVRAIGHQLSAVDGPEIVVVLPLSESGWMEQSSMGLLRREALAFLRAKDAHGRLRLLAPVISENGQIVPVAIHSKVLVIDDRLAKIGSANLSNRSMGLDSECDLAIESSSGTESGSQPPAALRSDDRETRFIASVRNRLLGEHLGIDPESIAAGLADHGSLLRIVDQPSAAGARRIFVPVPSEFDTPIDLTVFDGAMVDPPEPWNSDLLLARAIPLSLRRRLWRNWMWPGIFVALVLAAWALARHFDVKASSVRDLAASSASWLAEIPGGAFGAVAAFAIAAIAFVPFTILAATALTAFGLWPGLLVVWVGAVLGAIGSHALGRRLGPRALAWLPERSLAGVRRFLSRRGFWAVVLIRLLPVGNFGVLNMFAGAIGVPRRGFILGNMVGLLPGLLGLGLFVHRAIEAFRHPSVFNILLAATIAILGAGWGVVLKRRIDRRSSPKGTPPRR